MKHFVKDGRRYGQLGRRYNCKRDLGSRKSKMTEESNIRRVYAFQVRDSSDCRIARHHLGVGARIILWKHVINHARHVG